MSSARRSLFACLVLSLVCVLVPFIGVVRDVEAQASTVVINEFLAVNEAILVDNTGTSEDWIELANTTDQSIDLAGWVIADSSDAFTFPAGTTIAARGFLVVWASGDVTSTAPGFIHLPFKLSGAGESLTLRDPLGTLTTPGWNAPDVYPVQSVDDSFGIATNGELRYFINPTPGAANAGGVAGRVEPVSFSVPHGYYDAPQTITLDTATPASTIRYTIDGSTPTRTNGMAVASGVGITVAETSAVRAIAYRSGWVESAVESRTYLFTSDIVNQSTIPPAGWPDNLEINEMRAWYGIDPDLTAGQRAAVEQALIAIPTISISTDTPNLFDPTFGIWTNPRERGSDWEQPVSIELIDPTGAETGFDINGGLRIRGNSSRSPNNFKHSMRLVFDSAYGDGELQYPLFGNEGVDVFESVDLKTAQSWSWNSGGPTRPGRGTEATWLRDLWNRDSQGAMGQPYARSRYVHAFINGQYWGLYLTEERVSNQHAAQYTGGDEADFDIIKRKTGDLTFDQTLHVEARDGTLDDWLSLWPLVEDHALSNSEWSVFRDEVDLINLADFYVLSFYGGDSDSTPRYTGGRSNNWLAFRNRARVGAASKWLFNDRDSESALCTDTNVGREPDWDPTPPWTLDNGVGDYLPPENFLAPAWLFEAALTQPEFVQIFKDRVQLHMLDPDGALTVPASIARLNERAAVVDLVIDAEAARWGDTWAEPGFGRADWTQATQTVRECFQLRRTVIEQYLREDGLWPESDPPVISPQGGPTPFGTEVSVISDGGTLWVTLNGSDPRAPDGSVSAGAVEYIGPTQVVSDLTIRARVQFTNGGWSPLAEQSYSLSTPAGPVSMVLNEFNAVSSSNYLGGGGVADITNGSDPTLGRIAGNGGDWLEFMVVQDDLDIQGWTVEIWNTENVELVLNASLTFAASPELTGLKAGTIITLSEDYADDVSYNPIAGDWHMNLQSNSLLDGNHITSNSQSNFAINNSNTQVAIFDAAGAPVQLRTGEGTVNSVSVSSTEVFRLEGRPSPELAPDSELYDDGSSSTWGLPNTWDATAQTQDLLDLRVTFGDADCNGDLNVFDALAVSQYNVGIRGVVDSCSAPRPDGEIRVAASDVNGDGLVNVFDAFIISECVANVPNILCPGSP